VGEQRLGEWSKSIRAVAPNSATDQHRQSSDMGIRGSFPNQARLSDTCLAEDHQRRAVTRGQAIEGGSQHPQLLVAAHQHRAQQLRHALSMPPAHGPLETDLLVLTRRQIPDKDSEIS
jgi:hypothetical protein